MKNIKEMIGLLLKSLKKDSSTLKIPLILFFAGLLFFGVFSIISAIKIKRTNALMSYILLFIGVCVVIFSIGSSLFILFFGFNSP